jgi:uncharacterized protein
MTAERALVQGLRAGIRAYQLVVSPLLPPSCRFEPSCSKYGHEAIGRHGPLRGTWLTRPARRTLPSVQSGRL